MIELIKQNANLFQVTSGGAHIGWLNRVSRRTTGLHAARMTSWEGTINGTEISVATLTRARVAIKAILAISKASDTPSFAITAAGRQALEHALKVYGMASATQPRSDARPK
jgi:hypothetical protein